MASPKPIIELDHSRRAIAAWATPGLCSRNDQVMKVGVRVLQSGLARYTNHAMLRGVLRQRRPAMKIELRGEIGDVTSNGVRADP